jgi:hypothetical protein
MANEYHEFTMSAKESEYLKQLASRDESLAGLLRFQEGAHGRVTIRLSPAEAKQLRECLMAQMDVVGFDENYFPNEEGQMLEELIDRFFLR